MTVNDRKRMAQFTIAVGVILFLALVGVYDVYLAFSGEPQYTVSEILSEWAKRWPVLPFAGGLVVGHILWPQR